MVLEVLAYTGEVDSRLDAGFEEDVFAADAGEFEDLGGEQTARRQDYLLRGTDLLSTRKLHSSDCRAILGQYKPGDSSVWQDH